MLRSTSRGKITVTGGLDNNSVPLKRNVLQLLRKYLVVHPCLYSVRWICVALYTALSVNYSIFMDKIIEIEVYFCMCGHKHAYLLALNCHKTLHFCSRIADRLIFFKYTIFYLSHSSSSYY